MGLWRTTFRAVQDVTSLGGTHRLRKQQERFQRLREIYDQVRSQITEYSADLIATLARVDQQVGISTQRLKAAYKMLDPLGNGRGFQRGPSLPSDAGISIQGTAVSAGNLANGTKDYIPTLAGVGAGAGGTVVLWSSVQLLAHASTGAAMAGLHGVAAANAGWAWFGGGSLAAGGGGMAAGHILLPGIGTAIVVAVSSTMSHREANKTAKACEELEGANEKNTTALSKVQSSRNTVQALETKLMNEDQLLSEEIRFIRTRLFPFGFVSHLWRLLRFRIFGYYYKREELFCLERLDAAVIRFVSAFAKI